MYFEKYQILEDKSANTLSFNLQNEISKIDKNILNELIKIGLQKNSVVRVSTHKNVHEDLHNMVIFIPKRHRPSVHKHFNKTETYHIIDGKMDIVFFDNDGHVIEIVHLAKAQNLICKVPKNQYHTTIVISKYVIFHESRSGPYMENDSVLADWSEKVLKNNFNLEEPDED